ncbi:zinc ribbon domain-containing protein [Clostridium sp. ZBS12]|uniref:zinc ribbon domain-containing protein n=1 Tax=Clostridium sp. ZBS12 TaxID=2949972 RepID=UPI00207A1F70|nr:zinc ribbon domain-containing protein [Clostridium sp. ZBS12]
MPQIISKEIFAQAVLKARKRAPETNKTKENYLIGGIIRCGKHYQGNRRNAKNKPMYVSYRCSYRRATSLKVCDNKEIQKEYIEEYVLSELERKIFNDKAITYLVEGINKNLQKQNKVDDEKREVIIRELKEIDTQIGNIVTAIASGVMQEEFKTKMDELKNKKSDLEYKMTQLESKDMAQIVTEDDVRNLLNNFSGYVISRNIPECKSLYRTL